MTCSTIERRSYDLVRELELVESLVIATDNFLRSKDIPGARITLVEALRRIRNLSAGIVESEQSQ